MAVTSDELLTKTFTVAVNDSYLRLIRELTIRDERLNRSKIIRDALIEKADRDLPSNWREIVGFEDGEAA